MASLQYVDDCAFLMPIIPEKFYHKFYIQKVFHHDVFANDNARCFYEEKLFHNIHNSMVCNLEIFLRIGINLEQKIYWPEMVVAITWL